MVGLERTLNGNQQGRWILFILTVCILSVRFVMMLLLLLCRELTLKNQGHLTTCSLQARDFQKAKGLESNLQMGCLNQASK